METKFHSKNADGSYSPVIVDGMADSNMGEYARDWVKKQEQETDNLLVSGCSVR